MRLSPFIALAAVGVMPLLLASCAESLNSRDTVGASLEVESLSINDSAAVRIAHVETKPLTTLDRADFAERRFVVPVDGVRHQPTYLLTGLPEAGRSNSWRDAGAYPTAASALDVRGDACFETWNAVAGPVVGAAEILFAPIGMILAPPWTTTQSPAPARVVDRTYVEPAPTPEESPQ